MTSLIYDYFVISLLAIEPKEKGKHFVFGADPVNVGIAPCLSFTYGQIRIKLTGIHHWDRIGIGISVTLTLFFKVTGDNTWMSNFN